MKYWASPRRFVISPLASIFAVSNSQTFSAGHGDGGRLGSGAGAGLGVGRGFDLETDLGVGAGVGVAAGFAGLGLCVGVEAAVGLGVGDGLAGLLTPCGCLPGDADVRTLFPASASDGGFSRAISDPTISPITTTKAQRAVWK